MNLNEAKELLKKQGYKLIKEGAEIGLNDYTPGDIMELLYNRIYRY